MVFPCLVGLHTWFAWHHHTTHTPTATPPLHMLFRHPTHPYLHTTHWPGATTSAFYCLLHTSCPSLPVGSYGTEQFCMNSSVAFASLPATYVPSLLPAPCCLLGPPLPAHATA